MDADDTGREERLGIEDRTVDVRLGGEVDDRVGAIDQWPDDGRVGDVAADEAEPGGLLRVVADRGEIGLVAGVGQLVDDGDLGAVAARQDIADVARADEPGTTGDEQSAEPSRRIGHVSRSAG